MAFLVRSQKEVRSDLEKMSIIIINRMLPKICSSASGKGSNTNEKHVIRHWNKMTLVLKWQRM